MVLLVQIPVAPQAIRAAVVAEVLCDAQAEADDALRSGLPLWMHAADDTCSRNSASVPSGAKLPRSVRSGALLRHILQWNRQIFTLDEHIWLQRHANEDTITGP
eukprot:354857-Chlamydomonas_euryale.AAC.4